ncbi:MAG: hypothetical protein GTO54_03180, partial [Nitrososphaeria archaeon]|nr:hypothetical protein [Nitrososphaeria archaeon]
KLRSKYQEVKRTIDDQIKKREALPKKVNLFDRIKEEGIVRLCDEKKLFFDWLKMNAIWSKRKIVELVKPYYKDLRDVNRFVNSILNSRTYVRKQGRQLHVSFPPQRSKRAREALIALCNYANSTDNIHLDLRFDKITFSVGTKH